MRMCISMFLCCYIFLLQTLFSLLTSPPHTPTHSTLRHPNLVSLIGVSLDDHPTYLVTEYMAKGSLVDYLRSRGRAIISKQDQLDFAKNVCNGMVYLESKNFIHRCVCRGG